VSEFAFVPCERCRRAYERLRKMGEQKTTLLGGLERKLAIAALRRVDAQREEILEAFVTKYGFHPNEAIQIERQTATGKTWCVERRAAVKNGEELVNFADDARQLVKALEAYDGAGIPSSDSRAAFSLLRRIAAYASGGGNG